MWECTLQGKSMTDSIALQMFMLWTGSVTQSLIPRPKRDVISILCMEKRGNLCFILAVTQNSWAAETGAIFQAVWGAVPHTQRQVSLYELVWCQQSSPEKRRTFQLAHPAHIAHAINWHLLRKIQHIWEVLGAAKQSSCQRRWGLFFITLMTVIGCKVQAQ